MIVNNKYIRGESLEVDEEIIINKKVITRDKELTTTTYVNNKIQTDHKRIRPVKSIYNIYAVGYNDNMYIYEPEDYYSDMAYVMMYDKPYLTSKLYKSNEYREYYIKKEDKVFVKYLNRFIIIVRGLNEVVYDEEDIINGNILLGNIIREENEDLVIFDCNRSDRVYTYDHITDHSERSTEITLDEENIFQLYKDNDEYYFEIPANDKNKYRRLQHENVRIIVKYNNKIYITTMNAVDTTNATNPAPKRVSCNVINGIEHDVYDYDIVELRNNNYYIIKSIEDEVLNTYSNDGPTTLSYDEVITIVDNTEYSIYKYTETGENENKVRKLTLIDNDEYFIRNMDQEKLVKKALLENDLRLVHMKDMLTYDEDDSDEEAEEIKDLIYKDENNNRVINRNKIIKNIETYKNYMDVYKIYEDEDEERYIQNKPEIYYLSIDIVENKLSNNIKLAVKFVEDGITFKDTNNKLVLPINKLKEGPEIEGEINHIMNNKKIIITEPVTIPVTFTNYVNIGKKRNYGYNYITTQQGSFVKPKRYIDDITTENITQNLDAGDLPINIRTVTISNVSLKDKDGNTHGSYTFTITITEKTDNTGNNIHYILDRNNIHIETYRIPYSKQQRLENETCMYYKNIGMTVSPAIDFNVVMIFNIPGYGRCYYKNDYETNTSTITDIENNLGEYYEEVSLLSTLTIDVESTLNHEYEWYQDEENNSDDYIELYYNGMKNISKEITKKEFDIITKTNSYSLKIKTIPTTSMLINDWIISDEDIEKVIITNKYITGEAEEIIKRHEVTGQQVLN